MLSYALAVDLLHRFLAGDPEPPTPPLTPTDAVFSALRERKGAFAADAVLPDGDKPVTKSLWGTAANALPPSEPPLFDLDDALSAMTMLSFALPEGGAVAAAGLGVVHSVVDGLIERAQGQPRAEADTPLAALERDLERFIAEESLRSQVKNLLAEVGELRSLLDACLLDAHESKGVLKGFRPGWLANRPTRRSALSREVGFGKVWTIIEGDPFKRLMMEGSPTVGRTTLSLDLLHEADLGMCTIGAYCYAVQLIVNALIVYAFICLLPDDGLTPGFDIAGFNLTKAARARRDLVPDGADHSAADCLGAIRTWLDPDASYWNWTSRANPETGDARRAFDAIHTRLQRIGIGPNVPAHRPSRHPEKDDEHLAYFLAASDSISHPVLDPGTSGTNDVFRSHCANGQSEVIDTGLIEACADGFAQPYRGFTTRLSITWQVKKRAWDIVGDILLPVKAAAEEAEALALQKGWPHYDSPWAGNGIHALDKGTYWQLCWGPDSANLGAADHAGSTFMSNPSGRAMVAWLGYVLANYAQAMSYELDLDHRTSLREISDLYHKGWRANHQLAVQLLAC